MCDSINQMGGGDVKRKKIYNVWLANDLEWEEFFFFFPFIFWNVWGRLGGDRETRAVVGCEVFRVVDDSILTMA